MTPPGAAVAFGEQMRDTRRFYGKINGTVYAGLPKNRAAKVLSDHVVADGLEPFDLLKTREAARRTSRQIVRVANLNPMTPASRGKRRRYYDAVSELMWEHSGNRAWEFSNQWSLNELLTYIPDLQALDPKLTVSWSLR